MSTLNDNIIPYGLTSIEFETELHRILDYWSDIVFDHTNGRFYPKVDNENRAHHHARSGSVMYARILWAFSAGYRYAPSPKYMAMADASYSYIVRHFIDAEYGGIYWSVHPNGNPADSRKQIYAIAFTIYGLVEYYKIKQDDPILALAKQLYECIEQYSFDRRCGGYIEALNSDWTPTEHVKLSAKDDNEKKTLNTHLHILEAYTNLYEVWPDDKLKTQIETLLQLFEYHFVDKHHNHLRLFFDEQWQSKSTLRSFGHDIEASWLICEAANIIHGEQLPESIRNLSLRLAKAASEGLDEDGALLYEFNPSTNLLVAEKHWWVQAEAVVGFYRAGLLSGNNDYIKLAIHAWQYTTNQIIDYQKGEWHWGRDKNGLIMVGEDKAGFWKCPYHNSRCCLQMAFLTG